jgi:hypothetical protein
MVEGAALYWTAPFYFGVVMKFIPQSVALIVLLLCAACSSFQPAQERIAVDLRGQRMTIGSADAQFDKYFGVGGLQKQDITINYFPHENVVCLQYRVDLITYYQFWSAENRAAFIGALDRYKEDFAQKNLSKSMKTKRSYGAVKGYVIWETFQKSMQGNSYPNIELGYYFRNRAPYFALTQREAQNENETTKTMEKNSPNFIIYFTRAQAEVLAEIFAPEYLQGLSREENRPTGTIEIDEYDN